MQTIYDRKPSTEECITKICVRLIGLTNEKVQKGIGKFRKITRVAIKILINKFKQIGSDKNENYSDRSLITIREVTLYFGNQYLRFLYT